MELHHPSQSQKHGVVLGQVLKEFVLEAEGEEPARLRDLLQDGADFDEAEREFVVGVVGGWFEIENAAEESPLRVDIGFAFSVVESVGRVEIVAAQDVDVAADSLVILL